jgi:hypothetical protein
MRIIGMVLSASVRTDEKTGVQYRKVDIEGTECNLRGDLELPEDYTLIDAKVYTNWRSGAKGNFMNREIQSYVSLGKIELA